MKKIVTIGGGTGSYTVLSGLKNLKNISLTALVSMADDGGSSGRLKRELGVRPAGDVRQCLLALNEGGKEMLELLNYRFKEGKLSGYNLGNIFLAALEKLNGDFTLGVLAASWILKIKGKVIPITKDEAELNILFSDGKKLKGESRIDNSTFPASVKKIFYTGNVRISPGARRAILNADYIVIAPGNFYCSIIPCLIVKGFRSSLKKSKAKIIFVTNLVNKRGHTAGWNKEKYAQEAEKYLGKPADFILDGKELKSGKIFRRDKADAVKRSRIRHDPKKLAKAINDIIKKR